MLTLKARLFLCSEQQQKRMKTISRSIVPEKKVGFLGFHSQQHLLKMRLFCFLSLSLSTFQLTFKPGKIILLFSRFLDLSLPLKRVLLLWWFTQIYKKKERRKSLSARCRHFFRRWYKIEKINLKKGEKCRPPFFYAGSQNTNSFTRDQNFFRERWK